MGGDQVIRPTPIKRTMMRHIALGPLRVTNIALGTVRFGTAIPQDEAFRIMDRYVEEGGNIIDSAHVYAAWLPGGKGASERTIGAWLRKTGATGVIVSTKGGHPDLDSMDTPRLTDADVRADLEESLDRLGLYWLHRDDPAMPVPEIVDFLNELMSKGLVRAVGASNWAPSRIEEARVYAARRGLTAFCASQVNFSLATPNQGFDRAGTLALDAEARAYHEGTGLPVAAYTSQAKGFFAGKYDRSMERPHSSSPNVGDSFFNDMNFDRLERVEELAAELGIDGNEVALAYLFSLRFAICAIVGPRNAEQIAASCRASDVVLTPAQVLYLETGAR
jgi:aryl-alcohol dehydrogenase-like predicted oxidoreductase